ncbi:hypothetical protein LX32DRAFT_285496 [Colletotrichum zoysiae]|uniref:Uncharacterized protein n=1 Tax=Colletotrichum zoysiae TaxID=1216348 RepID=A0AAD9HLP3_9PEZI|nr:hypothetical protein LX32DRAFT_285496 [Colletotrichum zoysiae]
MVHPPPADLLSWSPTKRFLRPSSAQSMSSIARARCRCPRSAVLESLSVTEPVMSASCQRRIKQRPHLSFGSSKVKFGTPFLLRPDIPPCSSSPVPRFPFRVSLFNLSPSLLRLEPHRPQLHQNVPLSNKQKTQKNRSRRHRKKVARNTRTCPKLAKQPVSAVPASSNRMYELARHRCFSLSRSISTICNLPLDVFSP